MPRGDNPKSRENLKKGRPFCAETAREAAIKKHAKEDVTKKLMDEVADNLDIDKASKRLAELIAKGDLNAWKLWLEYTASRPATKVEMDNKMVFTFGEDNDTEDSV